MVAPNFRFARAGVGLFDRNVAVRSYANDLPDGNDARKHLHRETEPRQSIADSSGHPVEANTRDSG